MTIWKVGKKYRYHFERKGIRHTSQLYGTKVEATAAEAAAKKRARTIHLVFGRLCERRSEDLAIRRGKQYCAENQRLFDNLTQRWLTKRQITKADVLGYLNSVAKNQPMRANKELRLLKALFNFGVENELCSDNPVGRIKPYPATPRARYVPPIEDVKAVLAVAKPMQRAYLVLAHHTACRIRELNRLTWSDVFDSHVILRTRKAKNSDLTERRVPLTKTAKEVLASLPRDSEYVFTNPRTGTKFDYRKRMMKSLCTKAKVTYFSFHCLRHLAATTLSRRGVALTDIQKILGHQRPTTTDLYLRTVGDLAAAINKLEEPK